MLSLYCFLFRDTEAKCSNEAVAQCHIRNGERVPFFYRKKLTWCLGGWVPWCSGYQGALNRETCESAPQSALKSVLGNRGAVESAPQRESSCRHSREHRWVCHTTSKCENNMPTNNSRRPPDYSSNLCPANKANTEVRHICLKCYKPRWTPVKRGRKLPSFP